MDERASARSVSRQAGGGVALALFAAACCAAWKGDPLVAARLHGAADKEFDVAIADGVYLWTGFEQQVHDREQAKVRGALGTRSSRKRTRRAVRWPSSSHSTRRSAGPAAKPGRSAT